MKILKTKIDDAYIIELEPRIDDRGYFTRVFAKEILRREQIKFDIVHINRSLSKQKGTIRGIHLQKKPYQEDKIIQCLNGKIFDVCVDLRKKSKTFGKWVGVELSEENFKLLLVPKGCGHAFQTLTKDCLVEYFVTQHYAPEHEIGYPYNDPFFKIKWPIKKASLSEKDQNWPPFKK